jgi:asparagine synthase (glutamine-hydrolysing)
MCGIFVAFNLDATARTEEECFAAVKMVAHRGPDNVGKYSDGFCFLGHTRLSIIGLESQSNQPFVYENLVLVYNGEIFNYLEIAEELVNNGYRLDTHSDTEVVIKAFHKWGPDCFQKFNGMWALAIYDKISRKLIVSRDRFGQKPLFVMRRGDTTFFSSEFQQLAPLSDRKIDFELIQMFLKEGGYEGQGRTFYNSIEEFPKAHYFVIDSNKYSDSHRYWDYWHGDIMATDDAAFSEFEALLHDAVRIRLRADVPVGILLSGGVDSTIISAYARHFTDRENDIPAFTYSSRDAYDESAYAEKVAERLKMSLAVCHQDSDPSSYCDRLKALVRHLGRGHSSPAIVSTDYLYESAAKSKIKVVLDGQGADELLGGYKTYFAFLIPWYLVHLKFSQALSCFVDQCKFGILSSIILYLRTMLPPYGKTILRMVYGYERLFSPVKSSSRIEIVKCRLSENHNRNMLNRYLIRQHRSGLENLLYYGDIVAMRHSVENRSPFMDHRLVDFVFGRDEKLKIHNGVNKFALRALPVYDTFRDVLERVKSGFSSDISFQTKRFMIDALKGSPILKWQIFSDKVRGFIEGRQAISSKYERLLFRLYQVHLWNEAYGDD